MSAPLFSIVTVTLNCADDAVLTAQSVLAQDFADYEYIVKDGGSEDGTPERIKALGISSVLVASDAGIYDAMNQALKACKGEYVYFLNAGDTLLEPRVLSRIEAELDDRAHIVYGDLLLLPMRTIKRHPSSLSSYYLFKKNLNHQAWMARRMTYRQLGAFDLRYRFNADQYFLRSAILRHKVPTQHVDVILAAWRFGGFSTQASNLSAVRKERWMMLKDFYSPAERLIFGARSLYFLNPLKNLIWRKKYGMVS